MSDLTHLPTATVKKASVERYLYDDKYIFWMPAPGHPRCLLTRLFNRVLVYDEMYVPYSLRVISTCNARVELDSFKRGK